MVDLIEMVQFTNQKVKAYVILDALNPKPQTLNRNPKPQTLNPDNHNMINKIADNHYQKKLKGYYLQLNDKCEFLLKKNEKITMHKQKNVIESDNRLLTARCHT